MEECSNEGVPISTEPVFPDFEENGSLSRTIQEVAKNIQRLFKKLGLDEYWQRKGQKAVLVGGYGTIAPEVFALFGKEDSGKVTLVDRETYGGSALRLTTDYFPKLEIKDVTDSLRHFLEQTEETYDLITFLRITGISRQLADGKLLRLMAPRLNPGGMIILSGSFFSSYPKPPEVKGLNLLSSCPLPEDDLPLENHHGFLYRKSEHSQETKK